MTELELMESMSAEQWDEYCEQHDEQCIDYNVCGIAETRATTNEKNAEYWRKLKLKMTEQERLERNRKRREYYRAHREQECERQRRRYREGVKSEPKGVKALSEKQKADLVRMVKGGLTNTTIASKLSLKPSMVSDWKRRNKELWQ